MPNQFRSIFTNQNKGITQVRMFATKTIKVPGMGDSISEGTIQEIVKKAG